MGFKIIENFKENFKEERNINIYNTKIYIDGNPINMFIKSEDIQVWWFGKGAPEYRHNDYSIRLIPLINSEIEEEEHFGSLSDAIIRFNDIKEQYGKQ